MDSVHRTLVDEVDAMGLVPWFEVQKNTIISRVTGSEFIFKGLRHNVQEIKSLKGVTKVWVEEAQNTSDDSLKILIPTIREPKSELWFSLNADAETDPIYQRFIARDDSQAAFVKINWDDNPWFPEVLELERRSCLQTDPDAYDWIWEGNCRKVSDAVIFRNRVAFEPFETPEGARFYHGADWGFSNDPTALVRCFEQDETLYIDQEAFGYGVEIDDIPSLFDKVPTARTWPIRADSSRPETISYVGRGGFQIAPAAKWTGCVEDGVARIKGFKRIVVHPRCKHVGQEFRLYSYKVDRVTGEVLPIIVDKNNHGIDAIRYAIESLIMRRDTQVTALRL